MSRLLSVPLAACALPWIIAGCTSPGLTPWTAAPDMAPAAAGNNASPSLELPVDANGDPIITPALPQSSRHGVLVEHAGAQPACTYARKNAKNLTAQERQEFVAALLALKQVPSPFDAKLNWYDQFVTWHVALQLCDPNSTAPIMMGHGAPMFLPWHRLLLILLDEALRAVSRSKISVPYWDWTDHDTSAIFADDFMGGNGDPTQQNAVVTGPFRRGAFTIGVGPPGTSGPHVGFIQRSLGPVDRLPAAADVENALRVPLYDVAPWDITSDPAQSFRNHIEGNTGGAETAVGGEPCPALGVMPLPIGGWSLHNGIDGWVSGSLLTAASPNDPVFFLHHANIDRIWVQWQELHGVDTFLPDAGEYPANSESDELLPFHSSDIHVSPWMVANSKQLGVCYE